MQGQHVAAQTGDGHGENTHTRTHTQAIVIKSESLQQPRNQIYYKLSRFSLEYWRTAAGPLSQWELPGVPARGNKDLISG